MNEGKEKRIKREKGELKEIGVEKRKGFEVTKKKKAKKKKSENSLLNYLSLDKCMKYNAQRKSLECQA